MTEATMAGPTAPKLELHRPVKSWLQVTATCNLQCKQCYGDCTPEPKSDEMTVDQFHQVLDDMADSGVIELLVEGGEPLQRPDVLDILAHAAPRMLVRLRTNGTLLDEAMADRVRAAGIRNLCIDFMGATPETHDWHVGEPGAFEKTLNGLKVSLAAGFETLALVIMTKRNAGEIQQFIDLCAAAGVRRVGILRLYPLGRAKRHWKAMALSLPEQMAALEDLNVPDDVHLMRSWHPRDANCCWQASGVDARGQSVGCSYLRDFADFGNVLETPFLETWKHPLFVKLRSRDIEDHCPDCASTQGSAGGCRSTAYAFTGDWDAPDPYCTTTNRGIDVQLLPTRLLSEGT
ncbi:heme d1 biosynthesis radical SAM protein NirJ1 [Streptomyces nojiriensis]|uniref:Heme d1 biosynthesis radical SAM protein NirJ1 n=1 Tax=Streptomyces nojiriensis TaxID=66374 RepID=A0ABQ3SXH9_9ACTN|nr:radical SAM protein [Streptomyces nojiriensis]GGS37581.1 heme d1 biosynthesis radical SAM protein NirJ1 [Streptomyces nojiriensis]GHI72851.1 heme d1 biosynthesis radical SAM protein NirJ1 [Streptomyces nojiriensis]